MNKTYKYKNEKYDIEGYVLYGEAAKYYKTDVIFGIEDRTKWVLNINGKKIAFWNTGNNRIDDDMVIIENDDLIIITDFDYYRIDLNNFKCLKHIELDDVLSVTNKIIKYRNGYLIICDLEIVCLQDDKVKWLYDTECGFKKLEILNNDLIKLDILDAYGLYMYTAYVDKDGKQTKNTNNC